MNICALEPFEKKAKAKGNFPFQICKARGNFICRKLPRAFAFSSNGSSAQMFTIWHMLWTQIDCKQSGSKIQCKNGMKKADLNVLQSFKEKKRRRNRPPF